MRGGAVPLFRVSLQVFFERNAKRLKKGCYRTVLRVTERQSHGELALATEVNFSHQGNVSVRGLIELPVHLKVTGEIGPAVTPTNVATGSSRKLECAPECQPYPCLLCHQDLPVRYLDHIAVVTPSADLKMGRTKHVEVQLRDKRFITDELNVLENAGKMRIRDDFLNDGVPALGIGVGVAVAK